MIPTNVSLMRRILVAFIRNEVRKVGLERVVVGLSGGVDSSLSAMLAAEALGPDQVLGIMMPYKNSSAESLEHGRLVVEKSGIRSATVEITAQVDAYFATFPDADPKRRGNKMARERMTILYDHSARWDALVAGTSNKTELLLGYGTLHGDMASALNPPWRPLQDPGVGLERGRRRSRGDRGEEALGGSLGGPDRRGRAGLQLPRGGRAALPDGGPALPPRRAHQGWVHP